MRLRRIPGTKEKLAATGDILVKNPSAHRGRWQSYFAAPAPLHLEIGCGRGLFITTAAQQDPQHNYIGLELREEMIAESIQRLDGDTPGNLCFLWQDASLLSETFAPGEVEKIYLNFSDPWPKKRHAKRRLTHPNFLQHYQQVLPPGGLLQLKTDSLSLFDFSLDTLQQQGWRIVEQDRAYHLTIDPDNILTEYEMRFRRQGKELYRFVAAAPIAKEQA